MRSRLIRSILGIALLAVVTFGVPLALLARHEVIGAAQDRVDAEAQTAAAGLEDRLDTGSPLTTARLQELAGPRHITVTTSKGQVVEGGPLVHGPVLRSTIEVSGATIVVVASRSAAKTRVREVVLLVAGIGALAVVTAVALAVGQARRLAGPLGQVAARADALGRGDFSPAPLDSGIAEIDTISRQLDRSATQIGILIGLQRDFASDAAHQLRTPLTGIGLRLEEIALQGDGEAQQEAEEALLQVERLNQVITSLLARARGDSAPPTRIDLASLVLEDTDSWRAVMARRDRSLVVAVPPSTAFVLGSRPHLSSILTSLLDNALVHGAGEVAVSVTVDETGAVLSVSDEGPGVPDELVSTLFDRAVSGGHGTGIGLALARSLAHAEGGELTLSPTSRSELRFTVPVMT